jgi:putative OPT family oligopeptide transporter
MTKEAAGLSPSGDGFRPYVPATEERAELTVRAAIIGSLLGILFGASSVYLALKVGLTVSASIPIAVLSIPIFRLLGKGSILENNITQTVGSAGESIAAGVVFTVPALLVLGYDLELARTTLIALTGGWLGVMLMIPLRRSLIVKEHGTLTYPEGTACAEVLEAGETQGVQARTVFLGLGIGFAYKFFYRVLGLWNEVPERVLGWYKGASVGIEASPELLGVGYIVGPRIGGIMAAGGVLSYLVLIPMIRFFGEGLPSPLLPAEGPISAMSNGAIRGNYIYYIGAGAVAAGGIFSLVRALPTILSTFVSAMKGLSGAQAQGAMLRTERDLPVSVTVGGALFIALLIAILPELQVNPFAAVLIVVFAFFFSTVSSRICGQIGSSSNPVSGMTIATLLLTSLLFVAVGWQGGGYRAIALTVGAIVCIAAANAGATSQDLKTGFLVGATPRRQQVGLLIGVTTSALVVGWTLLYLNEAHTTTVDERVAHPKLYRDLVVAVPASAKTVTGPDGQRYREARMPGDPQRGISGGRVLLDEHSHVAFTINPGIMTGGREALAVDQHGRPIRKLDPAGQPLWKTSDGVPILDGDGDRIPVWEESTSKFEAPKAQLMALIIDGILDEKLPWALVLFGVFIALCLELAGIEALPFAVGLYLPLSASTPIFAGGLVRWFVQRKKKSAEDDAGPGVLLSSGLIAGGAMCGLVVALVLGKIGEGVFALPPRLGWPWLTALAQGNALSLVCFAALAFLLYRQATKD